jgi:hypothetical protein
MFDCLLSLLLLFSGFSACLAKHTVIVTHFSMEEAATDVPAQFLHALQANNPRSSHSMAYAHLAGRFAARHVRNSPYDWFQRPEHLLYVHACVSGDDYTNPIKWESLLASYRSMGVYLHRLHSLSNEAGDEVRNDPDWSNLVCVSQISDWYFEHNVIDVDILFIGLNIYVVGDLRTALLEQVHEEDGTTLRLMREKHPNDPQEWDLPRVFCIPGREILEDIAESKTPLCELDLLLIPSSIGTDWYMAINASASKSGVRSAHQAFNEAVRSVTGGVVYFRGASKLVVRAGQVWLVTGITTRDSDSPPMIEFDGVLHSYAIDNCNMQLLISGNEIYDTASVIMRAFRDLKAFDEAVYFQMLGCYALNFSSQFPVSSMAEQNLWLDEVLFFQLDLYRTLFKPPRIFDIIFAERGHEDLLDVQLRRQYLGSLVDAHLLIESPFDCNNRTEKPAYFFKKDNKLNRFYGTYNRVRGGGATIAEISGDGVVIENPEFDIRGTLSAFFMASVVPPIEAADRDQPIVCKNFIRNEGARSLLQHIAADSSDLLIILDIDEVPSRRSLQILRSLYAFDPANGRPKTLLPRIHRLKLENIHYSAKDRHCLRLSESADTIGRPSRHPITVVSAGVIARVDMARDFERNDAEIEIRTPAALNRLHPPLMAVSAKQIVHPGGWNVKWIRDANNTNASCSHENSFCNNIDITRSNISAKEDPTPSFSSNKRTNEICLFVDDVERLHQSSEMHVVFVTGQIGSGPALLPPRPLVPHRAVVLSNSPGYLRRASNIGYETKVITDIPAIAYYSNYMGMNEFTNFSGLGLPEPIKANDVNIYNAAQSKWLKNFPQYFLSPLFESHFGGRVYYLRMALRHLLGNNVSLHFLDLDPRSRDLIHLAFALISNDSSSSMLQELHTAVSYTTPDYIIWFDNKFALRTDNILDTLILFEASKTAMMMHLVPHKYNGVWGEYKQSLKQPRYFQLRSKMKTYIREQESRGLASQGVAHFQTGFIIFNMNHPNTSAIQKVWYQHIQRVGIQCQIAFYFVSQYFPGNIKIFENDWGFTRTFLYMFSSVLR